MIYRLDREILRALVDFDKRRDAKLRVCFANIWKDDLVKAYQLKIKDRDQDYMRDAVVNSIKGLLGPCNINVNGPREILATDLMDPPKANYQIRLTDQRITYSYYRIDDFAFIIPLGMTTENPESLVWVFERGTRAFDYYLDEYEKVFKEAAVKVYPIS